MSERELDQRRHDAEYRALREVLEDVARHRERITYGQLARRIDERVTGARLYAQSKELWHLLSRLAEDERAAHQPLLSVLVVHESDDLPGPGFFDLARKLGRMPAGMDQRTFVERETKAVYERWAPLEPRRS